MSDHSLRLLAQTADDLLIISTMAQDAVVKMGDIAWLPKEQRFAATLNRYRWEAKKKRLDRTGQRVRSGFYINAVLKAQTQDLPFGDPDQVLSLLAITCESLDDGQALIELRFSGGAAIRLEVECIDAVLEDLTAPWLARARPSHETET